MLVIPGHAGKDTCDGGVTRRELLRVGGSAFLGLTLGDLFRNQALAKKKGEHGVGFGKAKSILLIYLQGGPSHIDLWDPKEESKVRSIFKTIDTKTQGLQFTELLPGLAKVTDKVTMIRSMSYTPVGLFNHTAAIYQMMTGYTADKVSPSGQLEPPTPKDFPNFGSNVIKFKPPTVPMLPFVVLPRPLQESNVIGKGGTAGFLGRAYDPYTLYPPNADTDNASMNKVRAEDLKLRDEVSPKRMARRDRLRNVINEGMPEIEKATSKYDMDEYYGKALGLVLSGQAHKAFDLNKEKKELREKYGLNTFGQSCLLARRLIEAGTRVVELNWPKVANSDNHSWDVHQGLPDRMRKQSAPMLDAGLSSLIADVDKRGLLKETLVVCVGEFGRSPQRGVSTSGNGNSADGRDHWPYCFTACVAGAGVKRGFVYGKSDKTASAPLENPVHPRELLATMYHCIGLDPATVVMNHLNQPRELVQAEPVTGILS